MPDKTLEDRLKELVSHVLEIRTALTRLSGTDESILHEVRRLERRQDELEAQIRTIKDGGSRALSAVSDHRQELENQLSAIRKYVEGVGSSSTEQTAQIEQLRKELQALNQVLSSATEAIKESMVTAARATATADAANALATKTAEDTREVFASINTFLDLAKSPKFAAYVAIGAAAGGAIAAFVSKMVH